MLCRSEKPEAEGVTEEEERGEQRLTVLLIIRFHVAVISAEMKSITVELIGDAKRFVSRRTRLVVPIGQFDFQSARVGVRQPEEIFVADPKICSFRHVAKASSIFVPRSTEIDRIRLTLLDVKPGVRVPFVVDRTENVVDRLESNAHLNATRRSVASRRNDR